MHEVENLKSSLSNKAREMCMAWLQMVTVRLSGSVVLMLITSLGVVEDHVHLHRWRPSVSIGLHSCILKICSMQAIMMVSWASQIDRAGDKSGSHSLQILPWIG